ncbi:uncharacterized protein LOC124455266 [Xenia sp. Carnegie-2017]|uniref:uncharacterized protein LOC124455266 n=1 Tax=Xenia sp. Carnegie-2017 TaxID=2897299 RepID=UPI001F040A88|nr:uncharacterized protein LOC124455266 [Xenia sp. Carnegie-2017]
MCCDENDANHFAKLLAMNWSKIFVPSACGTCSCGAAWDKRDVSDDWLDVEGCHVAYLYDFHCVNVYYRPCSTCTNKKRYDGIENNVLWFGSFSISHAVLKDYIRHFLVSRLLDIDFVDAFHCNICGKHPKKVVMDDFISWPKMLIVSLREEHFGVTFPEPCIRLLKALASDKPVCAIVPPVREVKDLLIRIANGANPKDNPLSDLQLLHEQVPLLFCLCNHFAELPNPIRVLCGEMVAKASSPFTDQNGCERLPHNLPQVQCDGQLGFFPSLPSLVERGHYVLDTKRAGHLDDCAKGVRSKKKHGSLIPGIFLILCPHGICYGFQVMPDHESPNVPFTILRTRFSEAPELVIYDNACKLHEYCLNRDPAFFKKSKFIVDKFHWRNHSGCSEGYDINRYPILKNAQQPSCRAV